MLMLSRSWTFCVKGVYLSWYSQKTRKEFEQLGLWNTKKETAGKYTRARAPLARKYTNRIFESKDGTTSMKIVNYIERHNFCWNDLLTKSNRTEIQTYKLEERTFGTPCTTNWGPKARRSGSPTERCKHMAQITRKYTTGLYETRGIQIFSW